MRDRALAHPWSWIVPALLGAYAAAIALAPRTSMSLALAAPPAVAAVAYWLISKRDQWLMMFFAAALLLPPLPFGLGNSGPHPSLVFAAAGLLAGMFRLGEWRAPSATLNRALGIFFLILMGTSALAVFYSGSHVGVGSLTRVLLLGISVYTFFYTAYGPGARQAADPFRQARLLYWIAVASALFACVDFYYQFPAPAGFGEQYIWLRSGVYRRAQGLFYEASSLGNMCAFFLVMIVSRLLSERRDDAPPVSRGGLLAGGIVLSAALVLSFSRGSLVNVLVSAGVLIAMNRRRIRLGRLFVALAGVVVASALALRAMLPAFAGAYWTRVSVSVQYSLTETEGLLSGRVRSWVAVIEFLAREPWHSIFGVGYKTLPYSDYLGRTVIVDNMYLSLLAETGIVGLAAMLWLSVEMLRAARRAALSLDARRRFFGGWIFAFWIGQMAQMLTGDLLTYWRVLPLYFWVLAVAVRHEYSVP